jgi:glycine/D-amino acid oxidase-like deaminating enzyme/nitrite reductase/ring-hydroxylating ferredoxin subunit
MNAGDEQSKSCWMEELPQVEAPPLTGDDQCDVLVVGSGIAGLSTAYELARFDRRVIVIDRGRIGAGMTARTTAHLSSALDDYYAELIKVRGEDEARLYHDSQVAAINRIEAICRDEAIDADFQRVDGFLYAADESDRRDLETEYEACHTLGVDVEWVERAPIPGIDSGRALRFPNQARFHPTRYLAGLVRSCLRLGVRFHAGTAYTSHDGKDDHVEVTTESGAVVRAGSVVFATNSPVNDKVIIHTKQEPMRSYAIAGAVPKGSVADALVWDSLEAYHYVRLQPIDEQEDLLIVGGEDHRSGEANDMESRLTALESWTRRRYPSFGEVRYRWSGQVLEPIDYMPFTGRNPGDQHIYIHSGDSGQGITNGVAASLTLLPLIIGEDSRFAPLLDPSRKSLTSRPSLGDFVRGQLGVAKNLAEYALPGEIRSIDELAPGEGAIMRDGITKVAVYKDASGAVSQCSAICTHIGCIVHWNSFEKCWDCPCHGSHFAPDGSVLNGPAVTPLARHSNDKEGKRAK